MKHRLLLVDDDKFQLAATQEFLEKRGFIVDSAGSGLEALSLVRANPKGYSLVVLDYQMEEPNGAETARLLTEINPHLLILVFSADNSREAVLLSTRNGARGFVDKREGTETFLGEIHKLCRLYEEEFQPIIDDKDEPQRAELIQKLGMVGRSRSLSQVSEKVMLLKGKVGPVLILGESGTGKELVARALHDSAKGPFIAVNCADFLMSRETARSELFGHVKGAFTGALAEREGIFEAAKGGTVFLDEIYALPPEAQVGLLRALQEKKVQRLGSSKEIPIRCRIIAAAKPTLFEEIAKGSFKSDLFYRISQNILTIASLAERKEDISVLVQYFSSRWSQENGEEKHFLASTLPFLERYPWPGNVRELENLIYGILNTTSKARIGPEDLGPRFTSVSERHHEPRSVAPLRSYLERMEREHLIRVLSDSQTLKEAAEKLDLRPSNLIRTLKKHGLKAAEWLGTGT